MNLNSKDQTFKYLIEGTDLNRCYYDADSINYKIFKEYFFEFLKRSYPDESNKNDLNTKGVFITFKEDHNRSLCTQITNHDDSRKIIRYEDNNLITLVDGLYLLNKEVHIWLNNLWIERVDRYLETIKQSEKEEEEEEEEEEEVKKEESKKEENINTTYEQEQHQNSSKVCYYYYYYFYYYLIIYLFIFELELFFF